MAGFDDICILAILGGAEGFGVLCTAEDINTTDSRRIASFDHNLLLKFGELSDVGDNVYAKVTARIPVTNFTRRPTAHSSVVPDIKSILGKPGEPTTKETLAKARVGQGTFRAQILAIWGSRCCVTSSTTLDAIRASHIKPWRDSNDNERLDPNNGLPLIATLDALFDAGLITFAKDGKLMVAKRIEDNEKELLGIDKLQHIRQPNDQTLEYLEYHREFVFVD